MATKTTIRAKNVNKNCSLTMAKWRRLQNAIFGYTIIIWLISCGKRYNCYPFATQSSNKCHSLLTVKMKCSHLNTQQYDCNLRQNAYTKISIDSSNGTLLVAPIAPMKLWAVNANALKFISPKKTVLGNCVNKNSLRLSWKILIRNTFLYLYIDTHINALFH